MSEPLNSEKRGCRECRKPELHAEDCYFVDNRGFTNRRIIVLDSERSPAFEQGEPQPCSGCGLLYKHSTTCKYGDGSYNKAAILDSERSPKPQAVERHASTELQPCRSCRETEFHKQICHLSTLGRRSRVRDEERSLPRYQPATPQPQPEATDGWVYGELADGAAQTDEPLVELESFLAEYAPQPEAALCGEHCGHNPELMYRGVCRYQESKDGDICGHRCGVEAAAVAETLGAISCVCGETFQWPTNVANGEHVHCPSCGSHYDANQHFLISKQQVKALQSTASLWSKRRNHHEQH